MGPSSPRPLLAVPNVTAHPSTASVPITVLLYNAPLLCGFNVPIKGLSTSLYYLTKRLLHRSTFSGVTDGVRGCVQVWENEPDIRRS